MNQLISYVDYWQYTQFESTSDNINYFVAITDSLVANNELQCVYRGFELDIPVGILPLALESFYVAVVTLPSDIRQAELGMQQSILIQLSNSYLLSVYGQNTLSEYAIGNGNQQLLFSISVPRTLARSSLQQYDGQIECALYANG